MRGHVSTGIARQCGASLLGILFRSYAPEYYVLRPHSSESGLHPIESGSRGQVKSLGFTVSTCKSQGNRVWGLCRGISDQFSRLPPLGRGCEGASEVPAVVPSEGIFSQMRVK